MLTFVMLFSFYKSFYSSTIIIIIIIIIIINQNNTGWLRVSATHLLGVAQGYVVTKRAYKL